MSRRASKGLADGKLEKIEEDPDAGVYLIRHSSVLRKGADRQIQLGSVSVVNEASRP